MTMAANSAVRLPAMGTSNSQCMTAISPLAISMPMHRYGTIFPSMRPQRDKGLTSSCSSVPRSRSRTSDIAVANGDAARLPHDPKRLRVDKTVDDLPALHGAVLVEHDHRHVLHVVVQRIAEGDHFDQWRKEHEEERQRIAQHDVKFLVENGGETAKRRLHGRPPRIKHQTPSSKLQRNTKLQAPMCERGSLGVWDLELLWCLVFGVWCFISLRCRSSMPQTRPRATARWAGC